jgi:hypothetical protein
MSMAGRWRLGSDACRRWRTRAEKKEQMRYNRATVSGSLFFVLINRTYAVVLLNATLPAVIALVLHMLSVVRFSLYERKTNYKKKEKYHRE